MLPHRLSVLEEGHVVATEGTDKQHRSDVIKALDPLPSLRALATHVDHPEGREETRGAS